jgi:PIN like domain/SWIB/MDM2 domain
MRSVFPGHFRPTDEQFRTLWNECIFAVDANVLLSLYRYSPIARKSLMQALDSVSTRVFVPHQAAKEFLKNRLSVTAGQAGEYTQAIKQITELAETLSNNKRHPFLPEQQLPKFKEIAESLCEQLEVQKKQLLDRLHHDDTLDYIANLFAISTGPPFDGAKLKTIETEGQLRYQNAIPPGYKDWKKDSSGDVQKKFGDLIVWKQIIDKAKADKKPLIFITDDQKDDWWVEQSGRTIGPRPELIEEFLTETEQSFWMYSVDKFLEEVAKLNATQVSQDVIKEVIEVREDLQEQSEIDAISAVVRRQTTQKRKTNDEFMKDLILSDALAAVVGRKSMNRVEIVAKLWAYIKKHGLQDQVDKRRINADEKLLAIFGKPQVTMFEMAGLIGDHAK